MFYISDDGYLIKRTKKLSSLLEDVNAGVLGFDYDKSKRRVLALAIGPELLYGIDLDSISPEQEEILSKCLPDILKYESTKKRYQALKNHPMVSKFIPHLLNNHSDPKEGEAAGAYITPKLDKMANIKSVTTNLKDYVEPIPDEIRKLPQIIHHEPTAPMTHVPVEPAPTVSTSPSVPPISPAPSTTPIIKPTKPAYQALLPKTKKPVPVTAKSIQSMKPIEPDMPPNVDQLPQQTPPTPQPKTPAMQRWLSNPVKPPINTKPPQPILAPKPKSEISRPQRNNNEEISPLLPPED